MTTDRKNVTPTPTWRLMPEVKSRYASMSSWKPAKDLGVWPNILIEGIPWTYSVAAELMRSRASKFSFMAPDFSSLTMGTNCPKNPTANTATAARASRASKDTMLATRRASSATVLTKSGSWWAMKPSSWSTSVWTTCTSLPDAFFLKYEIGRRLICSTRPMRTAQIARNANLWHSIDEAKDRRRLPATPTAAAAAQTASVDADAGNHAGNGKPANAESAKNTAKTGTVSSNAASTASATPGATPESGTPERDRTPPKPFFSLRAIRPTSLTQRRHKGKPWLTVCGILCDETSISDAWSSLAHT